MLELSTVLDENRCLIVSLKGRLDTTTAPQLEELIKMSTFDAIAFDCAKLEYISSAGLRVFLQTKKQCATMVLRNVSEEVFEILEVTGFTDILTIEH